MGVLVSVSTLHRVSTIILSLWIQQMHQTSHEVLLMILVSLLAITSPAGSQRPLKCVSKKHNKNCVYNIFYKKSYQIFTTVSHYRGDSAIVQHKTNFVTVRSRMTVGGCSVQYEYKLLFTMMVGGTRCYLWLTTGTEQLTAGPHEAFLLISQNSGRLAVAEKLMDTRKTGAQ